MMMLLPGVGCCICGVFAIAYQRDARIASRQAILDLAAAPEEDDVLGEAGEGQRYSSMRLTAEGGGASVRPTCASEIDEQSYQAASAGASMANAYGSIIRYASNRDVTTLPPSQPGSGTLPAAGWPQAVTREQPAAGLARRNGGGSRNGSADRLDERLLPRASEER